MLKSKWRRGDRGAVTSEYAFILLAIAVAIVLLVQQIGTNVAALYQAAVAAF